MRLQLIAKSLEGDELAREIITVLAQQYNVQNSSLCAAMRDGPSVNGAAMRTVKVVFPKVVDVRCFSHAIYYKTRKTLLRNKTRMLHVYGRRN